MLVRIGVIMAPGEGRRRLKAAAQSDEAFIISIKPEEVARRAAREGLDLAIIGAGPSVAEVQAVIHALKGAPEPPEMLCVLNAQLPGAMDAQATLLADGCAGVIPDDLADERLEALIKGVLARVRDARADRWMAARRDGQARLGDFSTQSAIMRQFMSTVHRVVSADASLLILGETGVGKEHLARAMHAESPRASGPFVAVNCGALPEGLLESELFGHEKGAFTGAHRSRRGHFELAHGGTLFLDEIGEMPLHLQSKLLRALQERVIQPLGSERTVPVDVRVFAATNRDLEQEAKEKRFRADLFFRLAVVTLTIPPLRDRREDIPELAGRYLEQYCGRLGREIDQIDDEAMRALISYDWPGNVRELANVIERAVLLCADDEITLSELPESITGNVHLQISDPTEEDEGAPLGGLPERLLDMDWRSARGEVLDSLEREYLSALMARHRGRVGQVAAHAGMDPRSLFEKLKRHNLNKSDFRG